MQKLLNNKYNSIKITFENDRDFSLFILTGVFIGIALGINNTVFNNFLNDTYHLTSEARGLVEFPRELPGVMIMLVIGLLSFLGNTRIASIAMIASGIGMLGLGLFSPNYSVMLMWLALLSLGTHMFMPLSPAIGMSLSKPEEYGARLGRLSAYTLVSTIIGYAIVWFGFKYLNLTYNIAFIIAFVFFILAAVTLTAMKKQPIQNKKFQFVFRKKYSLFYALSIVNGARKQIFLTFAPWVLIQVYKLDPPVFAMLGLIIALLSIFTRTIVGRAIDQLGEKFVLSVEAIILIVISLGYTFSGDILPPEIAVFIVTTCYILDNSMSVVEMARSTYVKKIAVHPDDVIPTLSTGISLDHVVAMSMPFLGGMLWAATGPDGYKYIFIADAVFATINLILSRRIKIN